MSQAIEIQSLPQPQQLAKSIRLTRGAVTAFCFNGCISLRIAVTKLFPSFDELPESDQKTYLKVLLTYLNQNNEGHTDLCINPQALSQTYNSWDGDLLD